MDEMNIRFKELRLALGKTQEQFGEILGNLGKSAVSEIENGRNQVTERHIIALKNYTQDGQSVNTEWLRTGAGSMFKRLDTILSDISFGDDEFIRDFIEVYLSLDPNCRKALKEIMFKMAEKVSSWKKEGG